MTFGPLEASHSYLMLGFLLESSSSSSNLTSIYHRQTVSETPPRPGTSSNSTSSSGCKYKDTGEGQNGAGPIIKESMEGEGRLWRKKMSLEKRVKKRIRRSRAKSKRKRIPDSRSSMKKRTT